MFSSAFFSHQNRLTKKTFLHMRVKKTNNGDSFKHLSPLYKPKTSNQILYAKCLSEPKIPIVLGIGPAGTGKTLFACCQAISDLKLGRIQKIIITRPVVPVEEDIGFLPGSLIHKMDPWTRPIFDIFLEHYAQKDIDGMLHGGVLEISPLAYMRGRTFKRSFIIADEMQNSSPNQMLMLTTRIGESSKLVITGDLAQSDRAVNNGLADIIHKLKSYQGNCDDIQMIEMGREDIQRNPVVAKLLDIYSFVVPPSTVVPPLQPSVVPPLQPSVVPPLQPSVVPPLQPSVVPPLQPSSSPSTFVPPLQSNSSSVVSSSNTTLFFNNDAALIPKHHYKNGGFDV